MTLLLRKLSFSLFFCFFFFLGSLVYLIICCLVAGKVWEEKERGNCVPFKFVLFVSFGIMQLSGLVELCVCYIKTNEHLRIFFIFVLLSVLSMFSWLTKGELIK